MQESKYWLVKTEENSLKSLGTEAATGGIL